MNSKIKRFKSVIFFIIITLAATATINSLSNISGGKWHSLAIDKDGNLWAWGYNGEGQLGNGTSGKKDIKSSPIQIKAGTTFKEVASGWSHNLAIDSSGNLWAWGGNGNGQLGDGTTINKNTPVQIKAGTTFTAIAAGDNHSLAIDSDGNLWAWGTNNYGQLGDNSLGKNEVDKATNMLSTVTGNNNSVKSPVRVNLSITVKSVAAGFSHSLAIDTNGNLWVWGETGRTRGVATGATGVSIQIAEINNSPVKIDSAKVNTNTNKGTRSKIIEGATFTEGTTFTAIAARGSQSLAIDSSGNLWTWHNSGGYNPQFGGEGIEIQGGLPPVKIKDGTTFTAVAAGSNYSLAIDSSGNLWARGENSSGQIGDGTIGFKNNKKEYVQIKTGTTFVSVSSGWDHSLAIDKDDNLWTWGNNDGGQLGNGTSGKKTNKSSPVQIFLK